VRQHHEKSPLRGNGLRNYNSPNNPQALEITGLLDVSASFSWVYYKTKGNKKSLMHWIFPMHKASCVLLFFGPLLAPISLSFRR
jgi:hypothetical protein